MSALKLSKTVIQTILHAFLVDEAAFLKWGSFVGPGFFEDRFYKVIAQYLTDFFEEHGKRPATETVLDYFITDVSLSEDDREVYVKVFEEILASPFEDWAHYEKHLRLYVRKGAFERAWTESEELIENLDFDEVVSQFEAASGAGIALDEGSVNYFGPAAIEDRFERRVSERAIQRIPTHLGNLDKHLHGGGLEKGTFTVFVGRTSSGKSTALIHLGRTAILSGFKVLHITLELRAEKIADRYDCAFTGTAGAVLERQANAIRKAFLKNFAKHGDALRIMHFPEYSLQPEQIGSLMRLLGQRDFHPDMVLVDYADLMTTTRKFDERRHELNHIYTYLHRLAVEFDVHVVTVSQANRAAFTKKIIGLEDIAEDISKTHVADYVFCICQSKKERQAGRARLFLAKNRDGEAEREIGFRQDFKSYTFALPIQGGRDIDRAVDPEEFEEEIDESPVEKNETLPLADAEVQETPF